MITLTKTMLRARLAGDPSRPATDAEIARFFGVTQSAVFQWGDDEARIPERRAMQAALRRPDLFGAIAEPAANDDTGPEEHGCDLAGAAVDGEGAQRAESKVHGPASSAQPTARATMIVSGDQGEPA